MKTRKKKPRAQRKFAQGAFVPPSTSTTFPASSAPHSSHRSANVPGPVVINQCSPQDLLTRICLAKAHQHTKMDPLSIKIVKKWTVNKDKHKRNLRKKKKEHGHASMSDSGESDTPLSRYRTRQSTSSLPTAVHSKCPGVGKSNKKTLKRLTSIPIVRLNRLENISAFSTTSSISPFCGFVPEDQNSPVMNSNHGLGIEKTTDWVRTHYEVGGCSSTEQTPEFKMPDIPARFAKSAKPCLTRNSTSLEDLVTYIQSICGKCLRCELISKYKSIMRQLQYKVTKLGLVPRDVYEFDSDDDYGLKFTKGGRERVRNILTPMTLPIWLSNFDEKVLRSTIFQEKKKMASLKRNVVFDPDDATDAVVVEIIARLDYLKRCLDEDEMEQSQENIKRRLRSRRTRASLAAATSPDRTSCQKKKPEDKTPNVTRRKVKPTRKLAKVAQQTKAASDKKAKKDLPIDAPIATASKSAQPAVPHNEPRLVIVLTPLAMENLKTSSTTGSSTAKVVSAIADIPATAVSPADTALPAVTAAPTLAASLDTTALPDNKASPAIAAATLTNPTVALGPRIDWESVLSAATLTNPTGNTPEGPQIDWESVHTCILKDETIWETGSNNETSLETVRACGSNDETTLKTEWDCVSIDETTWDTVQACGSTDETNSETVRACGSEDETTLETVQACGLMDESHMDIDYEVDLISCRLMNETTSKTVWTCGSKDDTVSETVRASGTKDKTTLETVQDCGLKDITSLETVRACGSKNISNKDIDYDDDTDFSLVFDASDDVAVSIGSGVNNDSNDVVITGIVDDKIIVIEDDDTNDRDVTNNKDDTDDKDVTNNKDVTDDKNVDEDDKNFRLYLSADEESDEHNKLNLCGEETLTFRPSKEQFEDPIKYIKTIEPRASMYGICKIIPPDGFNVPCHLDDNCSFSTTNQYLGRLYHRWGPNTREMTTIQTYVAMLANHRERDQFTKVPLMDKVEVDLVKLYRLVIKNGGIEKLLSHSEMWASIARQMSLQPIRVVPVHKKLEKLYFKHILPYESLSELERATILSKVDRVWLERSNMMESRARNPLQYQMGLLGEVNMSDEDEEHLDASISDVRDVSKACFDRVEECTVPGRSMTLGNFRMIASQVETMRFGNKADPTTKQIEDQYWQIVSLANEHVCVHSASIDTSVHKLGHEPSPTASGGDHPWNMKRFGENRRNILRSLGRTLGVTVPTLCLSQLFSTNCWHMDPHQLAWVDFMHEGKPKIWYAISRMQALKFRSAMESLAPFAVQNKGIWLTSDTVMIPPSKLEANNVRLHRIEQNPGEFIVVFPRSFASSISTGLAVSESVYFEGKNWLDDIDTVFQTMRKDCEPAMFSDKLLLMRMARDQLLAPRLLPKVYKSFKALLADEFKCRQDAVKAKCRVLLDQSHKPNQEQGISWTNQEECCICRTQLILSKTCKYNEPRTLTCLAHGLRMFAMATADDRAEPPPVTLIYSNEELNAVVLALEDRIEYEGIDDEATSSRLNSEDED